jgi:hypothetical protein
MRAYPAMSQSPRGRMLLPECQSRSGSARRVKNSEVETPSRDGVSAGSYKRRINSATYQLLLDAAERVKMREERKKVKGSGRDDI